MITASAPGKAVLSGEYAVLGGAPAIVTAIDRRVRVTVSELRGDVHALSAPGYLEGSWHFRLHAGGEFEWRDPLPEPSAFSLVEEVCKSFDSAQWPSLSLLVNSEEFRDVSSGQKLGLGSSAAVALALSAALQNYSSDSGDYSSNAALAHDRFQDGRGSGVDIAASLHGGVIEYRRAGARSIAVAWPAHLGYRFLWSGQPAGTAAKLAQLQECRDRGADRDSMKRLSGAAEGVATAWSGGDIGHLTDAFAAYIESLRKFSIDHDLGIFDAGHEELVRLAADIGVLYKPCGAGGGDIGIVLSDDEDAITDFCSLAKLQGFKGLDIAPEENGVLIDVRRSVE